MSITSVNLHSRLDSNIISSRNRSNGDDKYITNRALPTFSCVIREYLISRYRQSLISRRDSELYEKTSAKVFFRDVSMTDLVLMGIMLIP